MIITEGRSEDRDAAGRTLHPSGGGRASSLAPLWIKPQPPGRPVGAGLPRFISIRRRQSRRFFLLQPNQNSENMKKADRETIAAHVANLSE